MKCEPGQKALTQQADCEMHNVVVSARYNPHAAAAADQARHTHAPPPSTQVASSHTHGLGDGDLNERAYAHNEQPRTAPMARIRRSRSFNSITARLASFGAGLWLYASFEMGPDYRGRPLQGPPLLRPARIFGETRGCPLHSTRW